MHDRLDHPLTLLPTNELTDFSRNLYELEKRAKRPYSLTSVLRAMCETPHKLGALEMEIDQELRALNPNRGVIGHLVPLEALSPLRRRFVGHFPVYWRGNCADDRRRSGHSVSAGEDCLRTSRRNAHQRAAKR
jgi:hypothetical protein